VGLIEKRGGRIHGMEYLDEFFQNTKVVNITTPRLRSSSPSSSPASFNGNAEIPKRSVRSKPMENGTINRILALLRRAMNLAHEDGLLHWVPYFPMLQENNVRDGFVRRRSSRRSSRIYRSTFIP